MIDSREYRVKAYSSAKAKIKKALPNSKVMYVEGQGYYISDGDTNVIAVKYPDLAYSQDVMSAYINLDVVMHWDKIEQRNNRNFRKDRSTVLIEEDNNQSSDRMADHINYKPDLIEE